MIAASLALLAVVIQCLVVQTHVDRTHLRFDSAVHGIPFAAEATAALDDSRSACIICQTALAGGNGVLTVVPAVESVAYSELGSDLAPTQSLLRRSASHDWRSRAPPNAILI